MNDNIIGNSVQIAISPLKANETDLAISLVAHAMASNPVHRAIFKGTDSAALKKQQGMFEKALKMKHNHLYAAKMGDKIVGVMCYMTSDHCQLKPLQLISMHPMFWATLGSSLLKVLMWRFNWKKHDYKMPHMHFGPLAVAPDYQGKGIGSALLGFFCDQMDVSGQAAYLETDKEINLGLYERFGFKTIEEDMVLGVKNWFMVRYPKQKNI